MSEPREYRICWEIDVTAESPEEAVRQAVEYLAPLEPTRWCYQAVDTLTGEVSKHEGEELF